MVLFFVLSGYITYEVIGLVYPKNNDEASATKQVLQYLMYSVINFMFLLPVIILLSKFLLQGPAVLEVIAAIPNIRVESLDLFTLLWATPNFEIFFLSTLIFAVESALLGFVWGKLEKVFSNAWRA